MTFLGHASAEVDTTGLCSLNDDVKGTWTIQDNPATLWLPKSGAANLTGDGSTADSPYDAQISSNTADPATASEAYTDCNGSFTCSGSSIFDTGFSFVSADMAGGLTVSTSSNGSPPRYWSLTGPFGDNNTTCSNGGQFDFRYPPAGAGCNPDNSDGGLVGYGASVPLSDVGQASFSLQTHDESTVNQAPYWNGCTGMTHTFSVTDGTYTFHKVCDGTIDYSSSAFIDGTCGSGPTAGPTVKVTSVSWDGSDVTDQVSCHGSGNCQTNETATSSQSHLPVEVARKHHQHKRHTVVVGKKTVTIPAGQTVTVKLPLNAEGRKLLKQFGKLKITLAVSQLENGKNVTVKTQKLTIKQRHKHHR